MTTAINHDCDAELTSKLRAMAERNRRIAKNTMACSERTADPVGKSYTLAKATAYLNFALDLEELLK